MACFCPSASAQGQRAPRLLIVPGLHDSGHAHWQTWLQGLYRHSVRVQQADWHTPDLDRWSAQIGQTLARAGPGPWIVAAHSFGCLALAHHLAHSTTRPGHGVAAALLVAPAEPDKFGLADQLPQTELPVLSTLVASETDPWMTALSARRWAGRWGSHWVNLGDVGHINAESGFGPLPFARRWVLAMEQRLARERRQVSDAAPAEPGWRFAV
ncbi:RBBP9/YdeN family alpha/beta hydrolase [Limnohabitans sp.]|uniref:RBBP9/YdeN family alpha/beta hydrolase n=1 Tax=Limnohabitans sp. TaxID=1907725 RepID=UPI0038B7F3D2